MTKINKLDMPSQEEVNEVLNALDQMLHLATEAETKAGQVKALVHHVKAGVKTFGGKGYMNGYEVLGQIAVQARLLSIQADTLADIAGEERNK